LEPQRPTKGTLRPLSRSLRPRPHADGPQAQGQVGAFWTTEFAGGNPMQGSLTNEISNDRGTDN